MITPLHAHPKDPMHAFPHAAGLGHDPIGALIEQLTPQASPGPQLGFLYVTEVLANQLPQLFPRLRQALPQVRWVGGVGSAVLHGGSELFERAAASALLVELPESHYRLLNPLREGLADLDPELGAWWQAQSGAFALLHADPENPLTPALLEQLAEGAAASFINGAFTSSSQANWQFAGELVNGALSGVIFTPEVALLTDHTQGCTPIGPAHQVTQAEGQVLHALDGIEPMSVLRDELARLEGEKSEVFLGLGIPGSDTGDYLVRPMLGYDPEAGVLIAGEELHEGQRLRFCRRDEEGAREDLRQMCRRLAQRLHGRPIRGAVYFDCIGRGRAQFGGPGRELAVLREELGEFPMVGLFAGGEVYNGRLYSFTGVLTLFL